MLGPFTRFLRSVELRRELITDPTKHPFTVPAIRNLDTLEFHPQVTFFIAIVLAYPHAQLFSFSADAITPVRYEETEHFMLTRDFLMNRERYLARLLEEPPPEPTRPTRRKKR